jgi:uncharacterized protein (DUF1330 family)
MTMQKGYIFAEIEVTDPKVYYEEYTPAVRRIAAEYGAKFLIASDEVRVLEGDRTVKRVILLEFESPERAREFFYSDVYQGIIDLRLRSSKAHLYQIDGTAAV